MHVKQGWANVVYNGVNYPIAVRWDSDDLHHNRPVASIPTCHKNRSVMIVPDADRGARNMGFMRDRGATQGKDMIWCVLLTYIIVSCNKMARDSML